MTEGEENVQLSELRIAVPRSDFAGATAVELQLLLGGSTLGTAWLTLAHERTVHLSRASASSQAMQCV